MYLTERDKCDMLDEFNWEINPMIEAIIDLRQEKDDLESKLSEKDDKIEELEDKISDLQKEIDDHECNQ